MALLPSPSRLGRALNNGAAAVVRRLLNIEKTPSGEALTPVPDDLPRDMLFEQPLQCDVAASQEEHEDGLRAVFKVIVRDAAGKRCPDLFVEAEVAGPERTAVGDTTTNMLGTAQFLMAGPPGTYTCTVRNVAAGALTWDEAAGTTSTTITLA